MHRCMRGCTHALRFPFDLHLCLHDGAPRQQDERSIASYRSSILRSNHITTATTKAPLELLRPLLLSHACTSRAWSTRLASERALACQNLGSTMPLSVGCLAKLRSCRGRERVPPRRLSRSQSGSRGRGSRSSPGHGRVLRLSWRGPEKQKTKRSETFVMLFASSNGNWPILSLSLSLSLSLNLSF